MVEWWVVFWEQQRQWVPPREQNKRQGARRRKIPTHKCAFRVSWSAWQREARFSSMLTLPRSLLSCFALLCVFSVALSRAADESPAVPASKKDGAPAYPQDIKVDVDVVYLPGDRKEKLDVYHPLGVAAGQLAPAVLYFHGGGFNDGDKAKDRETSICSELARAGFLAVSANYKLRKMQGQVTWPRNIHDCKLALRWLRDNAARLGVDPNRIGVMGCSAGGAIATLLAYTQASDGLEPPEADQTTPPRVACVVDFYGPMDLMSFHDMKMFAKTREEAPELYRQASALGYVDKSDPPTLIVHGLSDETVNVEQSEKLAAKLEEAGVPHELITIPYAPHNFDLRPLQRDLRPVVIDFLKKHLSAASATPAS